MGGKSPVYESSGYVRIIDIECDDGIHVAIHTSRQMNFVCVSVGLKG